MTKAALLALAALATFSEAEQAGLPTASNYLGLRLLPLLPRDSDPNVFYSPHSISAAMGMAYAGSRGDTQEELYVALGYKRAHIAKSSVFREHEKYTQQLFAPSNSTVSTANVAVIQRSLHVLPAYTTVLKESFDAALMSVDFEKNGQEAVSDINRWVSKHTDGLIKQIFENPPAPDTKLILLNTIYFKGCWQMPFNTSDTKKLPFYANGERPTPVNMMSRLVYARYRRSKKLSAAILELPYRDGDYVMTIMLPAKKSGISELRRLSMNVLTYDWEKMTNEMVWLSLPRFKFDVQYSLEEALAKLGMRSVFNPDRANLSGITGRKGIYVSGVVHKAVIEVDEIGSKAAASTALTIGGASPNETAVGFSVDHPFLFLIRSTKDNGILFVGEVNKP